MNNMLKLAVAFATGAVAMYFLDPAVGRRRRVQTRERSLAARHRAEAYVRATSRRTVNRLQGVVAKTRTRLAPQPVDDERLGERIRSKLGRLVDHPGAVTVQVHDGHVVLSGNAATAEIDSLMTAVWAMPGVAEVDNRLGSGAQGRRH